ncbi:transglutaminase domain-containing protein [Streptococcus panodentis]|uniref:Transglutaminase n=1 Tax=Streptococcus panodentis TaxID=1581472 RepID=A0ABS5ATP8_9STRE|nr:transglutaminase-like domain-containing protein [Streptococcus panodentis]MBP2619948.1 transglutaminase [Streptococcus panodentis]
MSRKIRFSILLILLVCFLPGCALLPHTSGPDGAKTELSESMKKLKEKYNKDAPYEMQDQVVHVKENEALAFPTKISKLGEMESLKKDQELNSSFEIYADSDLKIMLTSDFVLEDGKLQLKPGHNFSGYQVAPAGDRQSYELVRNNESWGVYDTLFLLQRDDAETGKALAKPKLWVVKIDKEDRDKISLKAKASLLEDGRLQLEWTAVPGADSYSIVKRQLKKGLSEGDPGYYDFVEIDRLESTVYRSDPPMDTLSASKEASQSQRKFRAYESHYTDSKDELEAAPYDLVVIPLKDHSPMGSLSNPLLSDGFASSMPDQIDSTTFLAKSKELRAQGQLPTEAPLLMMDGSIHYFPIVYEQVAPAAGNSVRCAVSIKGMPSIKDEVYTQGKSAEEVQTLANENNKNLESRSKSGVYQPYVSVEKADLDLKGQKVVKDVSDIEARVKGRSAMTEYFAKALANGSEYVDYSAFPELDYSSLAKVIQEVKEDNPTLPQHFDYQVDESQNVVKFIYNDKDLASSKKVEAKVKEVAKEIIKDGMSDREKVQAINQYLVDHATYNDAAYAKSKEVDRLRSKNPRSDEETKQMGDIVQNDLNGKYASAWDASGVLLEGTGVCQSYAVAFNALAQEAGLNSLYVSGDVNTGDKHAWNLVKIDGQWLVVDVTWNDDDKDPNQFLLLSMDDAKYLESHYMDYQYREKLK